MRPDEMVPDGPKCISIQRPKREELLFRCVLALPKASSSGVALSTCVSIALSDPAISARKDRQCLVASVLPAPDSPEIKMAWSTPSRASAVCAAAAT